MYDYDRRDKFGNPRQLHVDKALDVVKYRQMQKTEELKTETDANGNEKTTLVLCKYFECNKYVVKDELKLPIDEASFQSVMIVEGQGTISDENRQMDFKRGDSFFIPAFKNIITIKGACEIIVTHI